MGICGSKISPPDRSSSAEGTRLTFGPSGASSLKQFWLIVLYMVAPLFVGCITLQYGWQPPVERLDSLRPRISTPAEVLLVLGEPRGRGIVRYTKEAAPRSIWFYEYVYSDLKSVKIKFLLVLFEKEVYDGYLWFFSGSNTEIEWFFAKTPKTLDQENLRQDDGKEKP